ncbi:unnamed protein product [Porites evermanni]|uniref:Uncharacterized protein n=1 Tax=Porites evermanni TaxID=104178 RepID=A0ABN8SXT9_9CNID|nr:unnamed protein product [Porites evermanni]
MGTNGSGNTNKRKSFMIRTQLKAVSLRVLSFHDFHNLTSGITMNDGKIGTMKVSDSLQRERCTIYLFVTFFNALIIF